MIAKKKSNDKRIERDWPVRTWPTESNFNGPMDDRQFTHASGSDKCLTRTEVISQMSGNRDFSIHVDLHCWTQNDSYATLQGQGSFYFVLCQAIRLFIFSIPLPPRSPSHAHGHIFLQRLGLNIDLFDQFVFLKSLCLIVNGRYCNNFFITFQKTFIFYSSNMLRWFISSLVFPFRFWRFFESL